jgi:hypothetical protein
MKIKLESIKNFLQTVFQLVQCAVGCILGFSSEDTKEKTNFKNTNKIQRKFRQTYYQRDIISLKIT